MTSSDYWEPLAAASVPGETAVSAFVLPAAPLNPRLLLRLYGSAASPVVLDDTSRGAGEVDRAEAGAGVGGRSAAIGEDARGGGGGGATIEGAGGGDSPLVVEPDG
jgi:hypothetical protein